MSSCTDLLRLNEKPLFKDIRASLSPGTKETRNVLEIRDNVLYVWNADRCCVLTLNIAAARGKLGEDVPHQVNIIFHTYLHPRRSFRGTSVNTANCVADRLRNLTSTRAVTTVKRVRPALGVLRRAI